MAKLYFSNDDDLKLLIIETTADQDFDNEFSLDFLLSAGTEIIDKIKTQLKKLDRPFKKGKVKIFRNGVLIFVAFISVGCSISEKENTSHANNKASMPENYVETSSIAHSIEQISLVDNNILETTMGKSEAQSVIEGIDENDIIEIIETSPEINTERGILVSVIRSSGAIEILDLETYIAGVVAAEMPASFNIEALKAQAVASRTYAMKRINLGLMMTDTTATQRYCDKEELKKLWGKDYDFYYQKILTAVKNTGDNVIAHNNSLIDAVYHSTSNGATEDPLYVWGSSVPYLKSVPSPTDIKVSSYLSNVTISYQELSQKLGLTVTKDTSIEVLSQTANKSVNTIKISNKTFKGTEIRSRLSLRSTDFAIIKNAENAIITVRGFGHGVGMSQYGANGMANEGKSYLEILSHYYSGIKTIKFF